MDTFRKRFTAKRLPPYPKSPPNNKIPIKIAKKSIFIISLGNPETGASLEYNPIKTNIKIIQAIPPARKPCWIPARI